MADSIIISELSKRYRLGQIQHLTMLQETIVNFIKHPFQKLQKKDQYIWALKDVSFSVEEGEVVGIIGRNGAGKSTLLKILAKITYPTAGFVKVNGRISSLLEVGTGFHEELTGRENIFLNGSILGMKSKEINTKMDAIIDFAGVERFIDTPIKRYSSGMKLRLGFAVAAHLDPDVLFVDEVLAVGDADFQKKCLQAMDDLRTGGRTVLFVSHNMSAIENLCSRAIWIEAGQLKHDGESKEVIRTYLSTFAMTQKTGYDLSTIKNRMGDGAVRFTKIEFMDAEGNPVSVIQSGDCVKIRLFFHAREIVSQPHFGLKIFSETGTLVTTISTWGMGMHISHIPMGDGWIDLDIDSLNLMPSRYFITLTLQKVGRIRHDILDHCIALDIHASDVYNSGRGLDSRWGVMFLPGKWTFPER